MNYMMSIKTFASFKPNLEKFELNSKSKKVKTKRIKRTNNNPDS